MKKQTILRSVLAIVFIITVTVLSAQPGGIGGGQGQGGPPPGSGAVPIDGGLLLLVAGAALYGRKMMKSETKGQSN